MTSCSAQTQEGNGGGYVRPLTYFLSIQKKIKWDEDMFGPNSSKPGMGSCPASHLFSERQKKKLDGVMFGPNSKKPKTGSCSPPYIFSVQKNKKESRIQEDRRRGRVHPPLTFAHSKKKWDGVMRGPRSPPHLFFCAFIKNKIKLVHDHSTTKGFLQNVQGSEISQTS